MRAIYLALLGAVLGLDASNLRASPIAFDTAGDSAYSNFNSNGTSYPNGGYGWGGAWQSDNALFLNVPGLTGPGHPADTTLINSPMTSGGRAWGISYALNENLSWAQRPFAGALLPGQTFSMDLNMRTEYIGQYDEFDSQSVTLGSLPGPLGYGITVDADPGGYADYRVNILEPGPTPASYASGVPITDQYIHLNVEVIDSSAVRVTITSLGSDGATASLLLPDNVPIENLALTNQGFGYLPNDEMYFNNIQITPEPAGLVFSAGALAATLLKRRRAGFNSYLWREHWTRSV